MRLVVAALVASLVALALPYSAGAKSPPTTISGGDLAHGIALPYQDDDAWWRMASRQTLAGPPADLGTGYTVFSWAWTSDDDKAVYYPSSGAATFVRGGAAVWVELSGEQQALLDRYVTLGRAGPLPADPAMLDVLVALVSEGGERVGVQVAGRSLDASSEQSFWQEATLAVGRSELIHPFPMIGSGQTELNIAFDLPEGRSVSLVYIRATGYLIDMTTAGGAQTAEVTMQGFKATPGLRALLENFAPPPEPPAGGGANSQTGGSLLLPLWAIVTTAAAATIAVAGLAVGVARVPRRRRSESSAKGST